MSAREVYLKTRKVPDLVWNAYVCRPAAALVVDAIKDSRATPNQVTFAAFGVALASAVMLIAWPGYWGLLAAVVVFQLSYVLDCADGMLARWRGIQSTSGHLLDFLMDELKAFLILAAASVRIYQQHGEPWPLLLGLGGLVCLASGVALTTFVRRPEIASSSASSDSGDANASDGPSPLHSGPQESKQSVLERIVALVERVAKFFIHYPSYITFAALAGYIELYFFPYIAVNALYAAKALAGVMVRFGR